LRPHEQIGTIPPCFPYCGWRFVKTHEVLVRLKTIVSILSCIALQSCGVADDASIASSKDGAGDKFTVPDQTPFNEAYQLACHNCYEPKYWSGPFEDVFDAIKVVEVDLFDTTIDIIGSGQDQDWYVGHLPFGNNNNCDGNFSACLEMLARWIERNPEHDVITFFIDKKQNWGNSRRPADLDELILRHIPRDHIYAPMDFAAGQENLRAAIRTSGWPSMGSLNGKVIFALTGGSGIFSFTRNQTLNQYVADRGSEAVAFVAPDATQPSNVLQKPTGFSEATKGWVAFFNLTRDQARLGAIAFQERVVTRLWGEDKLPFCDLVHKPVNLVAMYEFLANTHLGCDAKGVIRLQ
jgi:hypothetical protein